MSNININDVIALAISHIRASGPVTHEDVADYLLDQSSKVRTVERARTVATLAICHGLGVGTVRTDKAQTVFFA